MVTASLMPTHSRSTPAMRGPGRAGERRGHDHQRPARPAGRAVAEPDGDAGGGDAADEQLALAADVEEPGPGRDGDGEARRAGAASPG